MLKSPSLIQAKNLTEREGKNLQFYLISSEPGQNSSSVQYNSGLCESFFRCWSNGLLPNYRFKCESYNDKEYDFISNYISDMAFKSTMKVKTYIKSD